jgi:hypothetical protein
MFLDSPRLLNIGAALLSAVLLGTAPLAVYSSERTTAQMIQVRLRYKF